MSFMPSAECIKLCTRTLSWSGQMDGGSWLLLIAPSSHTSALTMPRELHLLHTPDCVEGVST